MGDVRGIAYENVSFPMFFPQDMKHWHLPKVVVGKLLIDDFSNGFA